MQHSNSSSMVVEGEVRGGAVYVQKPHHPNPQPPPTAPPQFAGAPITTSPSSSFSSNTTPSASEIKRGRPSMPELMVGSNASMPTTTVLPKEVPYLVRSASATISGYYGGNGGSGYTSSSANSSGANSTGTSPLQSPTMLQFSMSPLSSSPLMSPVYANMKLSDPAFLRKELQDKSTWTADALKEHPEVLEIMERVRPLNRASSFGRLYPADAVSKSKVPDDSLGGRETLLQLIMQHLQYEGLRASRKILEEEANMKYVDYQLNESRLLTLMRLAIRDTERVWELTMTLATMPNQEQGGGGGLSKDAEETLKMLEEHLIDIGLLQETSAPDVSIWDEPEDKNVMYADEKETSSSSNPISPPSSPIPSANNISGEFSPKEGSMEKVRTIKAASLNHLVTALTPVHYYDPDYVNTFLLTYQSFTTPTKLMQKLIERYHVPMKPGMTEEEWKKRMLPIHIRVGKVLRQWMKEHWSDFTPTLIDTVKAFIDNSLRLDGNQQLVKTLTQTLNSQLRPEESEKTRVFSEAPPEPKVPKNIFSPYLSILDVDDEEIARQITLIDHEVFSSIQPSELLNQSWNKPKLRHRSPNVLRAISRFNEVSKWVTCSILRVERVKERARIMAKFIRIAEYAFKQFNNFDVTMAILAGLNQSAVHRLKHTKEEMPKNLLQTYNDLQAALSSNASYKEYRALLVRTVPPCIPYLGVFLTDLTFIEEGNPDYINGLINFSKRRLVYNVISRVTQLQLAPYNLQPVYQIACLLWHPAREFAGLNDDDFYKLSLEREPRGKDRSEIL